MKTTFLPRRRRRQQQQQQKQHQIVTNSPSFDESISDDAAAAGTTMTNTALPLLQRAGSSAYSSFVSLVSLNDKDNESISPVDDKNNDKPLGAVALPTPLDGISNNKKETAAMAGRTKTSLPTTTVPESPQYLSRNVISKTINHQFHGMTKNFTKSGLPWHGTECRSLFAGGSGILYCLPALFCHNNRSEQLMWIVQAISSILADYVYVSHDSMFHGMDRFYATFNTAATLWRAAHNYHGGIQQVLLLLVTSVLPLSCFVLANRAKSQRNLLDWQWYHGWWHITGSTAVAFTVYVLYHSHNDEEDENNHSIANMF
jgi:hypothetical protein